MDLRHVGALTLWLCGCYQSMVTGDEDVLIGDIEPEDTSRFSNGDTVPDNIEEGIFVNGEIGSDRADCTFDYPCRTINRGIELARYLNASNTVHVAEGVYREVVDLIPGVRIEGGWRMVGTRWIREHIDANTAVVIQAPETDNVTVYADYIGGHATLATLSVVSKRIADESESLYGIMARGASTRLTLEGVRVVAAEGGNGINGMNGIEGAPGYEAGCLGIIVPAVTPKPGRNGANGLTGIFTQSGYIPASGSSGQPGEPGQNGRFPTLNAACFSNCGICDSSNAAECTTTPDSCGTNGIAGCGGGGGSGGGPGVGGGSSVALFVWNAEVDVRGGTLEAGNGGKGANGGAGGRGGRGSPGIPGQQPQQPSCFRCSIDQGTTYYSTQTPTPICNNVYIGTGRAGEPGGPGSDGARGGDGGGAAGGFSYAIYTGGDAKVTSTAIVETGFPGGSFDRGAAGGAAQIGPWE
jgi:hypothetical protein